MHFLNHIIAYLIDFLLINAQLSILKYQLYEIKNLFSFILLYLQTKII